MHKKPDIVLILNNSVSMKNRAGFQKSFDKINCEDLFSYTPSATERAIYETKNHGRNNARKSKYCRPKFERRGYVVLFEL